VTNRAGFYSLHLEESDYSLTVSADPVYYLNNSVIASVFEDFTGDAGYRVR